LQLPDLVPARLAIKVKPAAERAIRQLHPWVFESALTKQSAIGVSGDLCIIYDSKKNKFLALGLLDPYSPIRIKLLQFNTPANIDATFFMEKVALAKEIRQPLFATDTNAYRLIFGENDGFPGFICDIYDKVGVIKLYSAIWIPYLKFIIPAILNYARTETLVLRLSRNLQKPEIELYGLFDGAILHGELENSNVEFREHGLKFYANVIHGHKTGYFLDHRHNRKRVGELSKGRKVLDIFSYAGGFTVHALAGGAREVISLDISRQAQELAKENVQLNFDNALHKIMVADAFKGMQELINKKERFDLIIVDPPSFAKAVSEIPLALKSYERLAKLALHLINKNGILLLASCSSRIQSEVFYDLMEKVVIGSNRKYTLLEKTAHDIDHPINFPEGAYLKSVYYQFKI